ncbi:glycosyltransferase family 2 protein [Enterobacter chuandaensis]|uniref:Glycosyltransferase family 2 protein n=1 Tax=Enterobacter chuandaensis TaxID=2497875 RepID=A0AA96LZ95_9ENTR|nr:glycosyltransferase family 2 protein [Enterobacter chuandaensis]MCW4782451.1 glycosyltransferase [Enterobacter chuandaensis]MDA4761807.1 glycosyltransferase [Enterobacter chuandaensis]WNS36499.1 glycosyltransferase family 2 protein [Enterobacter chuandaensis]
MKRNNPVLSIVIPTYNRLKYLNELLDNLLTEITTLEDKASLEIIVSDNASTDNVLAVIEEFREKGLAVQYSRNDVNIGMDGNFHKCLNLAKGDYFWMFGDDDLIVEGSIKKIIHLLISGENINIISLGCKPKVNNDKTESAMQYKLSIKEVSEVEFIASVGVMISFISSIIIKNNKESLGNDLVKFYGTHLIQLFWILKTIRSGTGLVIIEDKLVRAAIDNTGGYKLFTVFSESFVKLIDYYYSRDEIESILIRKKLINFLLYYVSLPKKQDGFQKENYIPICDEAFGGITTYKYLLRYFFKYPLLAKGGIMIKLVLNKVLKS